MWLTSAEVLRPRGDDLMAALLDLAFDVRQLARLQSQVVGKGDGRLQPELRLAIGAGDVKNSTSIPPSTSTFAWKKQLPRPSP
jgi:hypothetical protein